MNNNGTKNTSYTRHVSSPNERINNIAKQRNQRPRTRKNTHKRRIRGFVVGALAATMVFTAGKTLIGNLASQANTEKSVKQAITIATNYDKFEKGKDQDAIMNAVVEDEQENKLKQLTDSIKQYESLKNKNINDMQINERQAYNKAFDEIFSSTDLIRDMYINVVKAKIATAYQMKDIQNIKIKSYQKDIEEGQGYDAVISIEQDYDTTNIVQDDMMNKIFKTNKVMPKSLADAIIEAAEGNTNSNKPTPKEVVDANVKTFNDELIFANGVSYKKDNSGNIIEDKTKDNDKQKNNSNRDLASQGEER